MDLTCSTVDLWCAADCGGIKACVLNGVRSTPLLQLTQANDTLSGWSLSIDIMKLFFYTVEQSVTVIQS